VSPRGWNFGSKPIVPNTARRSTVGPASLKILIDTVRVAPYFLEKLIFHAEKT